MKNLDEVQAAVAQSQTNMNVHNTRTDKKGHTGESGHKLRVFYVGKNDSTLDVEGRYEQMPCEPIFKPDGIVKRGPNGGFVRYRHPTSEWKTFEVSPDGTETEIKSSEVKYFQSIDGQESPVDPFPKTEVLDINDKRPLDEATLNGTTSLGAIIPRAIADWFVPDPEKKSSTYSLRGDGFLALAKKLVAENKAVYFPLVMAKSMSVHLCVAFPIERDGNLYLGFRTLAGTPILNHPLNEGTVLNNVTATVTPILPRKQVSLPTAKATIAR